MNWNLVWEVLNAPAVVTALAGLVAWGLAKLFTARPAWAAFEGTIIAAIKWAEKEIPDNAPSRSIRRLDAALDYVLRILNYEYRIKPNDALRASLKQGIQICHARLEADGCLGKPKA